MKKITLFAALLLGVSGVTSANSEPDTPTTLQARATALTRSISDKARLDEGQYLRLKQLNLHMLLEQEDLKTRFAADAASLDQHLAAAQARYESDLLALLRPAQLALFQQSRTSMTALGTNPK
ncbi:hypothetical protein K3G63_05070 [Hymenobacter sp. HSC-4F20]|uniref:hypothetical protein n=1 Tax=Hymenobacter sp. HSC-4F20 TaxID=2864135 RepID=UPI001C7355B5|nr:hypothetical protein [Hymenobacter sp. HSC-4F20]MBX0289797.1 hypothetical protein [Hymenobacter sp. HSC-4F20]